jgi:hypothetical protein
MGTFNLSAMPVQKWSFLFWGRTPWHENKNAVFFCSTRLNCILPCFGGLNFKEHLLMIEVQQSGTSKLFCHHPAHSCFMFQILVTTTAEATGLNLQFKPNNVCYATDIQTTFVR